MSKKQDIYGMKLHDIINIFKGKFHLWSITRVPGDGFI